MRGIALCAAFVLNCDKHESKPVDTNACAPHIAAANSCDHALLSCIAVQVRVVMALEGVETELTKLREGTHSGR